MILCWSSWIFNAYIKSINVVSKPSELWSLLRNCPKIESSLSCFMTSWVFNLIIPLTSYPKKFIITRCRTRLHKTKSAKALSGARSCTKNMNSGMRILQHEAISTQIRPKLMSPTSVHPGSKDFWVQIKSVNSLFVSHTLNSLLSLFTCIRKQTAVTPTAKKPSETSLCSFMMLFDADYFRVWYPCFLY